MRTQILKQLALAVGIATLLGSIPAIAEDGAAIPSTWQVQEIRYSYMGFTTAYDCDAFEDKVTGILLALGAHPSTKVNATGCTGSRPSRNFFVDIVAATPVPVVQVKTSPADASKQELLKRLGAKSDFSSDEFPASWKSVDLSRERRLNLQPGDCELMEGLRDSVLPKLGVKITEQRISCTPHQVGFTAPQLKVSALVADKSPDAKTSG